MQALLPGETADFRVADSMRLEPSQRGKFFGSSDHANVAVRGSFNLSVQPQLGQTLRSDNSILIVVSVP